jgi:nicotinate-nucleotide adenylyltransferase
MYPDSEIFLMLGTDMYLSLEQWKNSELLLKTVIPAVFLRCTKRRCEVDEYSLNLLRSFDVKSEIIETDIVEISSSQLRKMLPKRDGIKYLAENVYSYIISTRLYNAKLDWNLLREQAHSMLEPKRVPHVIGCEHEAVRLARHWDVDVDDAREAAILHDITNKLDT